MRTGERAAVIDVGTNSVRLLVAEADGTGEIVTVTKTLHTVRTGEGVAATGRLSEEAMDRTVEAIAAFKAQALALNAGCVYCFATAAVRDSANKEEFIRRTHRRTQLLVDVLPGEVEAQVSFAGVPGTGRRCTVDIGGGSTDIVLGRDSMPEGSFSVRLGAVRASERYPLGDIADELTLIAMRQWVGHVMDDELAGLFTALKAGEMPRVYGVGGTCTTLAAMDMALDEYDSARVQGYALTAERVDAMLKKLAGMPLAARRAMPGLSPKRADIIIAGTVILKTFMEKAGLPSILVSDRDNLEGYLLMRMRHGQL